MNLWEATNNIPSWLLVINSYPDSHHDGSNLQGEKPSPPPRGFQCFITARNRKHQVLPPVRRRGLCTLQACLQLVWSDSVSRCVSAKLTGQSERQMVIRVVQMIDKFILLVNPAELFTTVAFSPHCAEDHCEEWGDLKTTETEVLNASVQLTEDKSWTVVYIYMCMYIWKIKYSGAKGNQIILWSKKGQHYRPHRLWLPSTLSAFNLLTSFSTHYSFLIRCLNHPSKYSEWAILCDMIWMPMTEPV